MIQTITVPEQTLEHIVAEVRMNLYDKNAIKGIVIMAKREVGSQVRPQYLPIPVNVTDLLTSEFNAGNLTGAEIAGFKKCIKAIIAKGMNISISQANDPL